MYHFIDKVLTRVNKRYSRQDYVTNRYINNRDSLIDYYRRKPKYLPNNHIIAKLIKLLISGTDATLTDPIDIIRNSREIAINMSSALGISTYKDVGKVMQSEFFNKNDEDVLVFVTYDEEEIEYSSWENLTPLRILSHDYMSMQMPLLNNKTVFGRTSYGIGYNVIAIEPGLLFFMYRQWKHEVWSLYDEGEKPTIVNFISQYILPNMFDSFTECAYFNRVMTIDRDGRNSINTIEDTHPLFIPDISRYVDEGISYMLSNTDDKMTAGDLLSQFVAPTGRSLFDVWSIEEQPHTRQIEWVMTIARVMMMGWIVKRGSKYKMAMDTNLRNKLIRRISQIKYNNIYPSVFGSDARSVQDYIDEYIYDPLMKK